MNDELNGDGLSRRQFLGAGVSAGSEHLARRLLEQHDEFVLNVPM